MHPKPGALALSAVWMVIESFHPEGQLRRRERVKMQGSCSSFLLLLVLTGSGLWNLLVCFIKVRQSTK